MKTWHGSFIVLCIFHSDVTHVLAASSWLCHRWGIPVLSTETEFTPEGVSVRFWTLVTVSPRDPVWFPPKSSELPFSNEASLVGAATVGHEDIQHYWIINKTEMCSCCFFPSHLRSTADRQQLWPCICCNGPYICRVSYFNHRRRSRNRWFKMKLKLESGYRVCMRKHIWIPPEEVVCRCIWNSPWQVLMSGVKVRATSDPRPFKSEPSDFPAEVASGTLDWRKYFIKDSLSMIHQPKY